MYLLFVACTISRLYSTISKIGAGLRNLPDGHRESSIEQQSRLKGVQCQNGTFEVLAPLFRPLNESTSSFSGDFTPLPPPSGKRRPRDRERMIGARGRGSEAFSYRQSHFLLRTYQDKYTLNTLSSVLPATLAIRKYL